MFFDQPRPFEKGESLTDNKWYQEHQMCVLIRSILSLTAAVDSWEKERLYSERSSVTYTSVASPVEDYSDIGSPEVDGPPSPDYVPGPEEPEQAPLSPDYVHGPKEPEQAPPSPVYLPYEDDEEDPKEDPADYPADSTVVALPAVDHVLSEEVTKPLPQIPSPPLPIPSPPPDSPTHIEIPESCLPLWKRLCFTSPTPSQVVGESQQVDVAPRRPMSKELDYGDYHHRKKEIEARMARETWGLSMDASDNAHPDVMSLHTTLVAHHALILDLQAADRRRQGVIKELLAADHKRQVQLTKALRLLKGLQTQMIEFQKHHGPAKGPAQPDAPGETDCINLLFCLATQYRSFVQKMTPKRTTRSTPVITTPTLETTTSVTNAQLQAMIDQGVTAALAARDANRNGDDNHTSGTGRPVKVARECTYPDFLKFQPLNLKGTEGVVGLRNALSWWNSHVKTTTPEAAHAMPWRTLKKMMTDKYCPRGEIKKLESEMWNLKVKGTDVVAYSQRCQELALMCDRMFPEEIDKVDNKRKFDDTTRNNHQQPNKRQNTRRAYAAGNGDRRAYKGPRPLCTKCNYHHDIPCDLKCHKCNRFGHLSRDGRNPPNVNTGANQKGNVCFECGAQGHFKKECPKLKNNNNRGNQVGNAKV
nr:hypothetical protein [Tanacetum cinerariifolium]